MAYDISYTDSVNKLPIKVNDSTTNKQTSLGFPGRNERGYGLTIAENFLHLLENFANSTPPDNPVEGQVWYDTTPNVEDLKVFDGTNWKSAGSIKKSTSTPSAGILGDLWVDTDNQQLFLFNGASWVLVGPTFSSGLKTGVVAETVKDSNDNTQVILETYIDDEVVSIYSITSFVPKVGIPGFSSIKAGINVSSKDFNGDGTVNKFWGISEKAENLLIGTTIIPASNVVRKDIANVIEKGITVKNDSGITTGSEGQLRLSIESGTIGSLYHSTPDSNFDIRVNKAGEITTLIRSSSTGNVGIGINNLNPTESLDVKGTVKISGITKFTSDATVGDPNGASLQLTGGATITKDLSVTGYVNITGNLITTNLLPKQNETYSIGSSTNKFTNVYAKTFYGDIQGNVIGNITGSVTGTASKLISSTLFKIDGDVVSEGFSYNGEPGEGGQKVFNTQISSNFITSKETLTDVSNNDTLLIYRAGQSDLRKMARTTFFSGIPVVPIGAIFPYAGPTPPTGYLFCDGSEKSRAIYYELFAIIGYTYGNPNTLTGIGTFRVPDLRGKFALGRNTMDNADSVKAIINDVETVIDSNFNFPATGATDSTAGILGNSKGNESVTLDLDNIPDHRHDLVGDNGTKFYTKNNNTDLITDSGAFLGAGPDLATNGYIDNQYLDRTGRIINRPVTQTVSPVNVMNPYLTINYIIYAGNV